MSDKQEKIIVSVWCRGPGVDWLSLTPTERLAIVLRNEPDDSRPALFEDLISRFSECGVQSVELDMHNPQDIYPFSCPVCKTDMNFDMKGFYKTYPQYEGEYEE